MSFLDLKLSNINYQLGVLTAQSGLVNVANTQANSVFYPMFCPTFGSIQPVSINQVGLTYRPNTDTLTSTGLVSSSLSSATITTSKITGEQSFSLNAVTGMSVSISGTAIGISLTTPNANNFSVGQKIIVQGNANGYFNGVEYTITQINSTYILQTNNPTAIPSLEVGGGGTVSGGIITTRDLTATNLNGKLNVVGGTSNSGNIIFCNNTTSTTGNFDLLTDSNQHLKFTATNNVLTVGGATNGAISIPSTAGTLTMATSGSIICNNYSNNGDNNVNFTAFSSGNNPSLVFNSRSSNSATASGRWGIVNSTGWNFEDGVSAGLQSTLCGVNSYGFFINNTAYIINGAKMNALVGGSRFTSGDLVIYPNASGSLNVISANMALRTGSQLVLYRPDEANFWTVGVDSGSQWVVSQSGGFSMYLLSGSAQTAWSTTSDERLKENIVPVGAVSSTLMKLQVKSYNYKSHPDALKSIGFIAQDIQQIPELVDIMVNESPDKAEDGTNYLGINQSVLTPYLVKAFQEQNKIITDQQKQIDNQQKQIDELKILVNSIINKPL
jgi:hypothetical protein